MAGRTGPATFASGSPRSDLTSRSFVRAAAQIPGELARIGRELAVEIREQGLWRIVLLATGLLVLGYGIQRLYWTMTRGWRKQVLAMPLDTVRAAPVRGRASPRLQPALAVQLRARQPGRTAAVPVAALLKTILSAVFMIIVVALLWGVLARFLLSPHNRRLRVFPIDDASARHWTPMERRSAELVLRRLDCHAGSARLRRGPAGARSRSPTRWACCCSRWPWSRCGADRRCRTRRSSAATAPATSRSPCPCCSRPCGCCGCSAP